MSRVSAVITTHNRCDTLKLALDSVLNQTYTDLEVIVVVDNSTDNTMEYLKSVEDPRVKVVYIPEEESRGGNYARNLGVKTAGGELIAFLDDDDIWYPEKIEKQVEIVDGEGADLVYCAHIDDFNNGKIRNLIVPWDDMKGDLSQFVFHCIFCTTSMLMVKKALILEVGGFDESLKCWQEYDLCIRLCQKAKVGFVKEPMMELMHNFQDSARLTNKYDAWVESVNYINHKYAALIKALPDNIKEWRKIMIYRDAVMRLETIKDYKKMRQYLKKIVQITHNKYDFARYVLNIGEYRRHEIKTFLGKLKKRR